MRHHAKRALCLFVSLSILLTLVSVLTLSTTAVIGSPEPMIAIGDKFMIVQTASGEVWGWGDNANGVLGNASDEETGTNITSPVEIDFPANVTSVAISAGADHVLALGSDGNVYAWGNNIHGQLGIENGGTSLNVPTLVESLMGKKIIAISAGRHFSLALTDGGQIYSFGKNTLLQLGYETAEEFSAAPTLIASLNGVFITQICAGYDSAIAIDTNGKAYLWGSTKNCVLGTDDGNPLSQVPTLLPDSKTTTPIEAVALSANHSAFLLNNGQIGFMGLNKYSQYGNGETDLETSKRFKSVDTSSMNITAIAASEQQTVLLSANGTVYTAGTRVPNTTETASTTFVPLFDGMGEFPVASAIAAGYQNGAMIAQDGSVWAWGDNSRGQLANGKVDDGSAVPTKVFQAENSAFDTGNTSSVKDVPMTFKTSVPSPTYAVVIPSSIHVGELRQTAADSPDRYAVKEGFTIEALNVANLYGEKEIVLWVEPGEGESFCLQDANGTTLPFDILLAQDAQTPLASGDVLARFSQNGTTQTWIRVDQSLITKSGVYNGVLTFRYSLVDVEN